MATSVGQFLSMPSLTSGASLTAGSSPWTYGNWVTLSSSLPSAIEIISIAAQTTFVTVSGLTREVLIELGSGSGPTTIIQVPYSWRTMTPVGFYFDPSQIFLPEPCYVEKDRQLSARATDSIGQSCVYTIKILYDWYLRPNTFEIYKKGKDSTVLSVGGIG